MENNYPIKKSLWALWILTLSLVLAHQLHANPKGALYTWPPQPRPPLQASIKTFNFDGMLFEQLVLKGNNIELVMPPLAHWKTVPSTPQDSIKFEYPGAKTLNLSFSLFGKNTFLPNLSEKTLNGYIEGLKAQYPGKIEVVNEGNYTPYKSFSIAGSNYKLIEYKFRVSDQEVLLTREYLLFLNADLLIIRIVGPPSSVMKISPLIDASLQQAFLEG